MKIFTLLMILSSAVCADMAELDDSQMQQETGQSGITISARADFNTGTRISYSNEDADYLDQQDYWLVVDNITGSIELKGLKIDLISDFGPSGNKGAVQLTLPDSVEFDKFKTDGLYMSDSKEVNAGSRFLMAVEIDGSLQMPAQTTVTIFSVQ